MRIKTVSLNEFQIKALLYLIGGGKTVFKAAVESIRKDELALDPAAFKLASNMSTDDLLSALDDIQAAEREINAAPFENERNSTRANVVRLLHFLRSETDTLLERCNKSTPLGREDAYSLFIGDEAWIVPRSLAHAVTKVREDIMAACVGLDGPETAAVKTDLLRIVDTIG